MAKKRIRACWQLLLALLLLAGIALSVGVTQARYQDSQTAVAAITDEQGVVSNCMVTQQDAPRTVLLGTMDMRREDAMTVPFWMLSTGSDVSGKLSWGVVDPEQAEYLNISVYAGYEALEPNTELELLEDIRLDLLLCLEPTDTARYLDHDPMKINVYVTWGEEMWGTFQVNLPKISKEYYLGDEAEPEETQPVTEETEPATEPETTPVTEPEETQPATEETEPATEPETTPVTEPEETQPATEETEPATEPETTPVTEPGETQPATEETEPTTEPETAPVTEPEETQPATEETEPVTEPETTPVTEPEEETQPATEETEPATEPETGTDDENESKIQLKTLYSFHPSEQLPMRIVLPEETTAMRMGIQTVQEDSTVFEAFPDYTMFSLDGGANYYMLYGALIPEFTLDDVTDIPILLNFSYADIGESGNITLAIETYVEETLSETGTVTVKINPEQSAQPNLQLQTQQPGETDTQLLGPILTFDNRLEFSFPAEWEEAQLEYSVERLTMAEDLTLAYVTVTPTENGLNAVYDANTHKLVFSLGEQFITPGVYRVNMTCTYEDMLFWDKQTTFFINYSTRTDTALSGQEVPNDN